MLVRARESKRDRQTETTERLQMIKSALGLAGYFPGTAGRKPGLAESWPLVPSLLLSPNSQSTTSLQ